MSHVASIEKKKVSVSVSEQIESKIRILGRYSYMYNEAETAKNIASGIGDNRGDHKDTIKALDLLVKYFSNKNTKRPDFDIETKEAKAAIAQLNIDFSCAGSRVESKGFSFNMPFCTASLINSLHEELDRVKAKPVMEYQDHPEIKRMALYARTDAEGMRKVFLEKMPKNLDHAFNTLLYQLPNFIDKTSNDPVFQDTVKIALKHLALCTKFFEDPINNKISPEDFEKHAKRTQANFRSLVPQFKGDANEAYDEITNCAAFKAYEKGSGKRRDYGQVENFCKASQEIGTMKEWLTSRYRALHEAMEKAGYAQEKGFSKTA